jgi:hypothetical protein
MDFICIKQFEHHQNSSDRIKLHTLPVHCGNNIRYFQSDDKEKEEEEVDEDEFIINESLQQEVSNMKICSGDSATLSLDAHLIRDFFLLMAVCNTVVVSSQPHRDKVD